MNIPELIKEHHQMMIDKGFHNIKIRGITQNDHITELIALIVGELLGEALEAHRCGRFADMPGYIEYTDFGENPIDVYKCRLYNTFEDEWTDVYLRIFDLCGYLNLTPEPEINNGTVFVGSEIIAVSLFHFNKYLVDIEHDIISSKNLPGAENIISEMLYAMNCFCSVHNIPIEKHMVAKMAYNKTRTRKQLDESIESRR